MSHSLEANNHNILEEAVNVAKRASFDSNSLSHLESLASERAQLVHKHRELHDDDAEQDVTSVHLYGQRARGLSIGHDYEHRKSVSS
ncbi:hypothetical protein WALSEDRAFT_66412 [Wallemia mellicola CBS 633.66]|uniref:Uncharacterized protein n=1 Tax=Wallemia mellicola (strain ATCC MYA-4683 / CBS 633.66) TaxID=671144 RepID=I4Y639_WALMC|nr:hypothetical protein WALSEDRAFT_66412 [Wallemia mellicola CBS 633.66]EIM19431.1 hypothetical protein WALSEDRAFT_66412 [Wallemia mellicola CBS 633.66]|eukprot:XP_006960581.1 hypothetical protein WALSEDRAFT_66412 [Wallemia mellicola CBS 633.66]